MGFGFGLWSLGLSVHLQRQLASTFIRQVVSDMGAFSMPQKRIVESDVSQTALALPDLVNDVGFVLCHGHVGNCQAHDADGRMWPYPDHTVDTPKKICVDTRRLLLEQRRMPLLADKAVSGPSHES